MPQNKLSILSTRPLPASLLEEAAAAGINISVQSFIETEAIQSIEVQQEIEQALLQSACVVFTSMNAVEAVAGYITDEMPDWMIYCMGQTTQELVKKYFGEHSIAGTADNATELAELVIAEADAAEVIFFCGNQRRDELPGMLRAQDIDTIEIIVYQTIATPHALNHAYNGILFYSPSAVESFFSSNKPATQTSFFAIGETTAAAIKKHSTNKVLTSDKPGKEYLVEKAINYFINSEW